jgi:BirA family biotin operon repressor/biotin-[acetyl-CoA-carboxylase] ligase
MLVRRYRSLSSTNDKARELAQAGAGHGIAVVADAQTRGRGTKGRSWDSPAGLGLYVSFSLRPIGEPAGGAWLGLLPLAAGVAVVDAVRASSGVKARLKWPNDVVGDKRKLGGVLAEAVFRGGAFDFAVVGVGLNVNQTEADFPLELRETATSLRLLAGGPQDRERLLEHLGPAVESWYNSLSRGEGAAVVRAAEERMAFARGSLIRVQMPEAERAGTYAGLGRDGRLLLELEGRTEAVTFEEIRGLDWQG